MWFASLGAPDSLVEQCRRILSPDEQDRADRFHFTRDRNRFVVGRAFLRELLGEYTGDAPSVLQFEYSPYGKPRLRENPDIAFNVSHSSDRAVYAVTRASQIGVDIEVLNSKPSDLDVAAQFFSAAEVRDYLSLPSDLRSRAFLSCWTRKEAFIKARGEGLSLPLQDFDVTLLPGAKPELMRTAWSGTESAEWELFDISDGCPGSVAALAVRARCSDVRLGDLALGAGGLERRTTSRATSGPHEAAQP